MMNNPFETSPGSRRGEVEAKKKRETTKVGPTTAEKEARLKRLREMRAEARKTYTQALKLDADLYTELLPQLYEEDLSDRVELIGLSESLNSGVRQNRVELSGKESGINQTYRDQLKGDRELTAYVKPSRAGMRYDDEGFSLGWNPNTLEYERRYRNGKDTIAFCKQTLSPEFDAARRRALSRKYDIPEKAKVFDVEWMSARVGLPAERLAHREYAVSHLNEILRWGVVPRTSLRLEADGRDVASAQEAVRSEDLSNPARMMKYEDLSTLWHRDPSEWENEMDKEGNPEPYTSLTRLACLDYLVGNMDRHPGNLLYDPVSRKFHGIDNGYAFGMATGLRIGDASSGSQPKEMGDIPLDPTLANIKDNLGNRNLRSVPIELVLGRMSLSQVDQEALATVAEKLFPDGEPIPHLQQLFTFLFEEERVAEVELAAFQGRFMHLVKNGTPPTEMKRGEDYFPIGSVLLAEWELKKAQQAQAANDAA